MADKFSDYYYLPLEATATIDGQDVPVTSFAVNYQLDAMPEALINVAIGRQAVGRGFNRVSRAHGILSALAPFTPVQLRIKLDAQPKNRAAPKNKEAGFPVGESFLLFTGFIRAPAQLKSSSGSTATVSFEAFGLPGALAGSTQFIAGMTIDRAPSGDSEITARLGTGESTQAVAPDALLASLGDLVTADLWTGGMQPLFSKIMGVTDVWSERQNDFGQLALSRIDAGTSRTGSRLTLQFDGPTSDFEVQFNRAMAAHLTSAVFNTWTETSHEGSGADLWDILGMLLSAFYVHFVPMVEDDAVAPTLAALSGDPHRVIDPNEYWETSENKVLDPKFYSYVTGVGLYSTIFQASPWQDGVTKMRALGQASIDPSLLPGKQQISGSNSGRLVLVEAPGWLILPGAPAKDTVNPGGEIPDSSNAEGGQAPTNDQGKAESSFFSSKMGDAVAQAILYDRVLAHRQFRLTGRLRVDIAPGSLIQVNTTGELFSGKSDTLFGQALGVRIEGGSGTGGSGFARTTITLGSVRSEDEHGKITRSDHPMYLNRWAGATLVKGI